MTDLARTGPSEVDFLAALRARGLVLVGLGALVGAAAGFSVSRYFLVRHEAHAVLRLATLGLMGPVVPMSEARARAESRTVALASLTAHGDTHAENDVYTYKVTTDLDSTRDGTVVTLTVVGPDAALTLGLAQDIVSSLQSVTHAAFVAAVQEQQEQLTRAAHTTDAFRQAAGAHPAGQELADQTEVAMEFERWAGEVSSIRQRAQREVLSSRDTDVIDAPYLRDSNARALLVAALGGFAGMLIGLALAVRPTARAAA